jgi:hypothetical protein
MKVTKKEFLVMLKYTEFSYISRLLRNGLIITDTDGLIDLENPQNKKWIKMRNAKLAKTPENDNINSNKPYLMRNDLSLKAKGLMSLFLALPEDWEYSLENIMAICKESKWGVRSTIRELKNLGYLSVVTGRNDNGYFNSIYKIYENPKENPNFNKVN